MPGIQFFDIKGTQRDDPGTMTDESNWDMASDPKYKKVKQMIQDDTGCRVKGLFEMY